MPAIRPEAVPSTERPSLPHQSLPALRSPHFPLCALRGLRARPRPPSARNLPPPSSGAQRRLRAAQSEDLSLFPQFPSTSAPPGRACETAAPSVAQTASPGVHGLHHDPKSPVGPCVNSVRGHPEQPFSPTIHLPRFPTRLPWAEARISALPASRRRQFSNFPSVIFNLQSLHPITRQP